MSYIRRFNNILHTISQCDMKFYTLIRCKQTNAFTGAFTVEGHCLNPVSVSHTEQMAHLLSSAAHKSTFYYKEREWSEYIIVCRKYGHVGWCFILKVSQKKRIQLQLVEKHFIGHYFMKRGFKKVSRKNLLPLFPFLMLSVDLHVSSLASGATSRVSHSVMQSV